MLITAGYMLSQQSAEISGDVLLLADRPMEECLNYVAGSFAHLVLVADANRGAGHISAVSAMLLGKPQIFSDVAPLKRLSRGRLQRNCRAGRRRGCSRERHRKAEDTGSAGEASSASPGARSRAQRDEPFEFNRPDGGHDHCRTRK